MNEGSSEEGELASGPGRGDLRQNRGDPLEALGPWIDRAGGDVLKGLELLRADLRARIAEPDAGHEADLGSGNNRG